MRLVLASNNAKKLAELSGLFAHLPIELVAQPALGIEEAEELHASFVENALAKARHAARASGAAAIADDSGLCVDALVGAPGVGSAGFAQIALPPGDREAQRRAQDAANNALLLDRLHGNPARAARYVATLVALRSADDPEPLIAVGRWQGTILPAPRGRLGFGYNPLMFIAELGCSVAEMPAELKAQHSHRAIAARNIIRFMREAWGLG